MHKFLAGAGILTHQTETSHHCRKAKTHFFISEHKKTNSVVFLDNSHFNKLTVKDNSVLTPLFLITSFTISSLTERFCFPPFLCSYWPTAPPIDEKE